MVETVKKVAGGSWRTTVAGALSALALVAPQVAHALDDNPATVCDWSIVIGAVLLGLGLGAARDNVVTSAAAGAEPKPNR